MPYITPTAESEPSCREADRQMGRAPDAGGRHMEYACYFDHCDTLEACST